MSEEELGSEIPDFVKKFVPGITRGLSWAKYSKEKAKGTEIKVDAYNESKREGYQTAIKVSSDDIERVFEETKKELWSEAEKFTAAVLKIEGSNAEVENQRENLRTLSKKHGGIDCSQ